MMAPGMTARKIQPIGNFQNWTKKRVRSDDEGVKDVETCSFCLSRSASSPIFGSPMKRMIEMAAAYSERPMRMYR